MSGRVVIAGGTGFIGNYLRERYERIGYEVVTIARSPGLGHVAWTDRDAVVRALDGADLVINLAGRSVNCRYHRRNREEILRSRVETTAQLGAAIGVCSRPPKLWINSSTATIYRHAADRPMTEEDGEIGTGFSVDVAKAWEESFFRSGDSLPGTRLAALRIAIVLGPGGGVMTPYLHLVRYGLGGHQGSGRQMFSWIHIEDVFGMIRFLETNERLSGVFNASAPFPVTNREQMRRIREAMGRRFGLPAARWMLEIGAWLLRTETELVLKSRWVLPQRLLREGYVFRFEKLDTALADIIRR